MNDELFSMAISDDLRDVDIIYKGERYRIWYDQYMGEYYGQNETRQSSRFCVGRYEYRNAPDNWCPLPDPQDFKNGFITDRLHDMAREFMEKNGYARPRCCPIYNAEYGKPFRYGDHYCDTVPDAWSIYYRDGEYFYIRTDDSGILCCKKQFSTEDELIEWLDRNEHFKVK